MNNVKRFLEEMQSKIMYALQDMDMQDWDVTELRELQNNLFVGVFKLTHAIDDVCYIPEASDGK